jgi:F-type H+/Na+-transporting ATPase subunit alpha
VTIRPEEISSVIMDEISDFKIEYDIEEIGTIINVGDGVAHVYGLNNCVSSELIEFPHGVFGMALNLNEESVGCILFGSDTNIQEGDKAKRTGRVMSVPVGDGLLGRVVNSLGQPIDGKGTIISELTKPIDIKAPYVIHRQPVKEPLQTGIKSIDSMVPIGRGQRELIIGDRQTGKTAIAVDAIISQKNTDVICIYVAIGQKMSTVAKVVSSLEEAGVLGKTIVVVSCASDTAPMQYIAPFSGTTMGEYYRDRGRHALIVYDDLSKHAVSWRQVALILRRPPGREAYPGDVFYLHSRLLERSANLSDELGGGSLTALPIIETHAGDISAYIPTNVISITDGQIYLESNLFYSGFRPAINAGLSVSRVGGSAQIKAMKQVAGQLRLDLAQFRELEAFTKFGADLDKITLGQLRRGQAMMELLKQDQYKPMAVELQIVVLFLGTHGYLDTIPLDKIHYFETEFIKYITSEGKQILETIKSEKELTAQTLESLTKLIEDFSSIFTNCK